MPMMDNAGDKWNETGCFVYQLLGPVGVRSSPSGDDDNRTERSFSEGEMVAIDLIRHSRTKPTTDGTKKDGPYLRLADHSGWMFERKKGEVFMKRMPVDVGLWTLYADNFPVGIHLRNHPIDLLHKFTVADLLLKPNVSILPMQKIYCDRKVTDGNGIQFYRVQGIDNAWVFDKRIISGEEDHFMLLPENKVRTGLFAYQILDHVAIRSSTSVSKKVKTSLIGRPGDLVVGDVLRESPFQANNGPFLRLTDGSGWLFVYKYDDQPLFPWINSWKKFILILANGN
jgi:hypothetical protein